MMNKDQEIVNYWLRSAKRDWETVQILFDNKKYDQALFYCHLFLEKTLKAVFLKKQKKIPPYTHKLTRLALLAELDLTSSQKDQLDEITTFNLEARYDDYKSRFYKKATKDYAKNYLIIANNLSQWLLKQI